jgi:hypothetical protein
MTVMGRPTDYDPAFCEQVIAWGREGRSHAQIAARLDVARSTLYLWRDQHPEFSDALTRARDFAQNWWEDKGQEGLTIPGFSAPLWAKQVSCRFREDYTDTSKHELTGKDGGAIETVSRIERTIVSPHAED